MFDPLWCPSKYRAENTLLAKFMREIGVGLDGDGYNYDLLHLYSIQEVESFWGAFWDFSGLMGTPGNTVIEKKTVIFKKRFFPDARLNYAENLLKMKGSAAALISYSEAGLRSELSWDQLKSRVSRLQQALIEFGIGPGDRVAAIAANTPDTIIAMLATTSLGAIWSSCSPDFGVSAIHERLVQIEPKVLFGVSFYNYNGTVYKCEEVLLDVGKQLKSVKQIVVLGNEGIQELISDKSSTPNLSGIDQFIADYTSAPIRFHQCGFNDPLFIMFSSGTTGKPKCIVHSVGGVLLQHLKEHQLQFDIKPTDKLFYFTTCGWMMWNWLTSAMASGATLILYDGNPMYPDWNSLFNIVKKEKVSHFGVSAKFIDTCAKRDLKPIEKKSLACVRVVLSTGSPLSPENFEYIYNCWCSDVCVSSIAGGTDILGCFVGGNPVGPVYAGECQKIHLGMNVAVFNSVGQSVIGEPGELVCLSEHPSMPIGFWNDPSGMKYYDTYFKKYNDVWTHGDWVVLTNHGGMIFLGRSDATLNPSGVRIGTAEIYREVDKISAVLECVVVGQEWLGDIRIIMFVVLQNGSQLSSKLMNQICRNLKLNASPRHVPAKIIQVTDIPRTKSGKLVELAIREVLHNRPVKNTDSLINPECLDQYRNIDSLKV